MIEIIKEYWLLSILATILLGAIGSGLWDWILRPAFHKLGKLIFFLLTFGAKRASDNIYREAARGHHELPSLFILLFVIAAAVGLILSTQIVHYNKVMSSEASFAVPEECIGIEDFAEKKTCIRKHIRGQIVGRMPYLFLLGILISVMFLYKFIAINRTNLAVTYFYQCLRVCKPFIENTQMLEIESRFALMESKDNYSELIDTLQQIAMNNEIVLPKSYV